jgi:hypothetical protein
MQAWQLFGLIILKIKIIMEKKISDMHSVIHSFLQNLVYIFFAAGNTFIPIST